MSPISIPMATEVAISFTVEGLFSAPVVLPYRPLSSTVPRHRTLLASGGGDSRRETKREWRCQEVVSSSSTVASQLKPRSPG